MTNENSVTEIEATSQAKVFLALSKCHPELSKMKKNKTADAGKYSYSYVDLATILETAGPVLTKNELCLTQVIRAGMLLTVLGHSSGEQIQSHYPLPDPSRMSPQDFGSQLTYARRYSVQSILGIAAEEDDDAQAAQNSYKQNKDKAPAKKQTAKPKSAADVVFEKGKFAGLSMKEVPLNDLDSWVKYMEEQGYTKGDVFKAAKAYVTHMNKKQAPDPAMDNKPNPDDELPDFEAPDEELPF